MDAYPRSKGRNTDGTSGEWLPVREKDRGNGARVGEGIVAVSVMYNPIKENMAKY